jgi:hypothetical protein
MLNVKTTSCILTILIRTLPLSYIFTTNVHRPCGLESTIVLVYLHPNMHIESHIQIRACDRLQCAVEAPWSPPWPHQRDIDSSAQMTSYGEAWAVVVGWRPDGGGGGNGGSSGGNGGGTGNYSSSNRSLFAECPKTSLPKGGIE